jgi:aubergine-like protein
MAQMSVSGPAGGAKPAMERRGPPSEPRTRPDHITDKRGAAGQPIPLRSNFVVLRNRPNCALYQYNVSYSPPIESRGLRAGLLSEHTNLIGNVRAFDGMILFLPRRLPDDVTEVVSVTKHDQTPVTIKITLTNEVAANSPVSLQVFNVIFRRILGKMDFKQIGRHYYNPKKNIPVPQHKLDLWPGFITSILQYEDNVMLCADVSHKIMRSDTVYDTLNELHYNSRNFHEDAIKTLVGEIVLTRYNNKTYRVDDIDWERNPTFEFEANVRVNGPDRRETERKVVTMVQYYQQNYNIAIQDHHQPLLVSKPKKRDIRARGGDDSPILLVPELCTRTGLSEEARADFRLMKDVAIYTRVSPDSRMKSLGMFMKDLQKNEPKEILDGWNLEFDREAIQIEGRVLPPETIFHSNKVKYNYNPASADWSREMRGHHLLSTVNMEDYMILFTGRDRPSAKDFIEALQRVGPPMGFNVGRPNTVQLENDRTDNFLKNIRNNLSQTTQMVIVVLPSNRKDRYDSIKKLCCVELPVPSQCILQRTLSKKQNLMSVATKVAMQLNCKLGGELWAVEVPVKNLMVVGIDSTTLPVQQFGPEEVRFATMQVRRPLRGRLHCQHQQLPHQVLLSVHVPARAGRQSA